MITDPLLIAALLALVLWDVGRRFASRGRQINPEEIDHLVDRVTACEAAFAQINAHGVQITSLKERVKGEGDQTLRLIEIQQRLTQAEQTLKSHGQKLTKDALSAQPLARPIRGPVFPKR